MRDLVTAAPLSERSSGFGRRSNVSRKHREAVTKVLAAISKQTDERFNLADLRRIAGVSERTLNDAFHEQLNLSPARFMKQYRLQGAHQELLRSAGTKVQVREVANKWGFWHMGQFAKDYRATFGELPSETLRRKAAKRAWK